MLLGHWSTWVCFRIIAFQRTSKWFAQRMSISWPLLLLLSLMPCCSGKPTRGLKPMESAQMAGVGFFHRTLGRRWRGSFLIRSGHSSEHSVPNISTTADWQSAGTWRAKTHTVDCVAYFDCEQHRDQWLRDQGVQRPGRMPGDLGDYCHIPNTYYWRKTRKSKQQSRGIG